MTAEFMICEYSNTQKYYGIIIRYPLRTTAKDLIPNSTSSTHIAYEPTTPYKSGIPNSSLYYSQATKNSYKRLVRPIRAYKFISLLQYITQSSNKY